MLNNMCHTLGDVVGAIMRVDYEFQADSYKRSKLLGRNC